MVVPELVVVLDAAGDETCDLGAEDLVVDGLEEGLLEENISVKPGEKGTGLWGKTGAVYAYETSCEKRRVSEEGVHNPIGCWDEVVV